VPTASALGRVKRMMADERTRPTADHGIDHIRRSFASADAIGSFLA
jgi:hypothetical protein